MVVVAVGVEHEDAARRVVVLGVVAAHEVSLPDDVARVVVEAGMLLGEVDVDVAVAPVALARIGYGARGLLGGDVHGRGGAGLDGGGELRHERGLVGGPAVVVAVVRVARRHGDLLAVGARVGARLGDRVVLGGDVVLHPRGELRLVKRGVVVLVEGDPVGNLRPRDLAGGGPAQREGDVCRQKLVGVLRSRLEGLVGRGHLGLDEGAVVHGDARGQALDVVGDLAHERVEVDGGTGLLGNDLVLVRGRVERDGGVRGLGGLLVVCVDDLLEDAAQLVLVEGGAGLGGDVVCSHDLEWPGPGVDLPERALLVGGLVEREADVRALDRVVEPIAGDVHPVGGYLGRVGRAHRRGELERDVPAVERRARQEDERERGDAREVHDGDDRDDDADCDGGGATA